MIFKQINARPHQHTNPLKPVINWMVTLIVSVMLTLPCNAHPVIWKDGQGITTQWDTHLTSYQYQYSLSHRWSLGGHYLRLHNDSLAMAHSHWLIKRWNKLNSQANWYAMVGLGQHLSSSQGALHIGSQVDWETRRWYTLARFNYYDYGIKSLHVTGRLGVAPYIGDFDDVHTWIMAQVDWEKLGSTSTVRVIPVIRVFYNTLLVEVGHDFNGRTTLATMIHF